MRQAAGGLFVWKLAVLLVIVLAAAVVCRPFCKYLCPLGAFYALFNRFSFYQMGLDRGKCVDCKKCERACPMGVEVTREINGAECIRCGSAGRFAPQGRFHRGFRAGERKRGGQRSEDDRKRAFGNAAGLCLHLSGRQDGVSQ